MGLREEQSASLVGDYRTGPDIGRGTVLLAVIAAGWLGFMAFIALEPRPPRIIGLSSNVTDAAGHFAAHALLAAWIYLAARSVFRQNIRTSVILGFLGAAGLGLLGEFAQSTLTDVRTFQRQDVLIDIFGAFSACVAISLFDVSGSSLKQLSIGTASTSGLFAVGVLTIISIWNPAHPYPGDHWHVQYAVVICGEVQPPVPGFQGGIHSHGEAGVIHIHPVDSKDAGSNATLGRFFSLAGGRLTDGGIAYPGGEHYGNGDRCPDGEAGTLSTHLFDLESRERTRLIPDPENYVPNDREAILIEFGSKPYDFGE